MNEWAAIWGARDIYINGFFETLYLFVISSILAFLLGCVFLFIYEGKWRVSNHILIGFVSMMRTLPFLILAYLMYYGLPQFGIRFDATTAGLLALWIYHGAYFFEIFRGQRIVMPKGLIEAAVAHGFRRHQVFIHIILPYVTMSSLPLLGNQLIICLKDTAFLCIITVQEITAAANSVQATYFIPLKAFLVAIALYWVIGLVLEFSVRRLRLFSRKRGFTHV
ncbi:amino acid ABC transporter permease [Celerinatantimonas sp. MCCC 1A17872]|uniref:amino acid ABC transporter permease n=1 Tax=Celerinatantimonas sp. MCCC 1A17872 TaxID=3177514 RepID=UPI0038CAE303